MGKLRYGGIDLSKTMQQVEHNCPNVAVVDRRRTGGKLWTSLCPEIRTCVWRRMRKLQGTLLFHCKLEGCMEYLQLWFPSTLSVWALWVTDWRRVWRSWVCRMLKVIPKLLPSLELPISWKRSPVFKATGQWLGFSIICFAGE